MPTLAEIDLLPYHALQAEAAKHGIRRNLSAAKLREALKLLGSNLPSALVNPARRKRAAIEDDLPPSPPNKKAKLAQPAAGPFRTTPSTPPSRAIDDDVLMAGPSSPATTPQPSRSMRLFPSAKKAPAVPQHSPSPPPSPIGPLSYPTLYGTENLYGDTGDSRFGDFMGGSTTLLPSPYNRRIKPFNPYQ